VSDWKEQQSRGAKDQKQRELNPEMSPKRQSTTPKRRYQEGPEHLDETQEKKISFFLGWKNIGSGSQA
jgi:hypothetical protein